MAFSPSANCEHGEHMSCQKNTCICECHHGERGLVAVLTFESYEGEARRATMKVYGIRENLDSRIIDAIGVLRAAGKRMVKTEMTVNGEDWVYQYDSTGHVEHVLRMGDDMP